VVFAQWTFLSKFRRSELGQDAYELRGDSRVGWKGEKRQVIIHFGWCTIVDTYFHSSCVLGENRTKQHSLPFIREVPILYYLLISRMGASVGPDPFLRDQWLWWIDTKLETCMLGLLVEGKWSVDLTQAWLYCSSQPGLESAFIRSILNKNGSMKADSGIGGERNEEWGWRAGFWEKKREIKVFNG
jgi:hypothetical protein